MPLQNTSGNNTTDAYGGGAAAVPNYIEDVFSTWLVTPASSNTTYSVTNGIDVSGKGGMVWMKSRSSADNNLLYDTARGASAGSNNALISNSSSGQQTAYFDYITGLSNGFTVNFATGGGQLTNNGINYASWTFRKQPKFFDVVTYTGTGSNRTIAHNLGSVPGCIIVKRTDATGGWGVYHNSLTSAAYRLLLNSAAIEVSDVGYWNSTNPTSTVFSIGNTADVNASGGTYIAYIFAHNAGGFGLTGTDNVITCGSFSVVSGAASVTLGYEPQYIMYKNKSGTIDNWTIMDNMRGFNSATTQPALFPNTSNAESFGYALANATGFTMSGATDATYIYIAIRRGPMKVPTDATKVFEPATRSGTGTTATVTSAVSPIDMLFSTNRDRVASSVNSFWDRLRGGGVYLNSNSTNAEASSTSVSGFDVQNGVTMQGALITNGNSYPYVNYNFKRAPSFFDEVCYDGSSSTNTIPHNLGVAPELMIIKCRNTVNNWAVYNATLGNTQNIYLSLSNAANTTAFWNNTTPTSTAFTTNASGVVGSAGNNYVAYLFATCAGVSKVGSYTGTGTTQTISCGFTGGARFVLIKRTDSTGNWGVLDTARGMVSGTDPYLNLNTTSAEVNANNVYTTTGGFQLVSSDANFNANGGSYIFLAVA